VAKFKSAKLDRVMLFGTKRSVGVTITAGPARTAEFLPPSSVTPISYPSVKVLAKAWNGAVYVIAVNSNTQSVKAKVTGLPQSARSATVLFEGRTVAVRYGAFTDSFSGLGTHVYRLYY
jgi:hypothetical protein